MGDLLITLLGLWVFVKILKVVLGGWSKSDYQRGTGKIQPTECSL